MTKDCSDRGDYRYESKSSFCFRSSYFIILSELPGDPVPWCRRIDPLREADRWWYIWPRREKLLESFTGDEFALSRFTQCDSRQSANRQAFLTGDIVEYTGSRHITRRQQVGPWRSACRVAWPQFFASHIHLHCGDSARRKTGLSAEIDCISSSERFRGLFSGRRA